MCSSTSIPLQQPPNWLDCAVNQLQISLEDACTPTVGGLSPIKRRPEDDADMAYLLTNLSETLASVNTMASDLAFELEGARRHFALGIQQMFELGELLANRALDIAAPRLRPESHPSM